MVPILLALGTALSYGSADFLGGLASRGTPATRVLLTSQVAGLATLGLAILVLPVATLTSADVWWSLGGGVAGLLGLVCLYRGLGGGPMVIVSAVAAVLSAVVPVLAGVAGGDVLGSLAWVGIVLGLAATGLVSSGPIAPATYRDRRWQTVSYAIGAGTGIGMFLVCLAQCRPEAGVLPLAVARALSIPCLVPLAVISAGGLSLRRLLPAHPWPAVGAGTLDLLGTVLFMVAAMTGPLSVLGVLAAQYPVVTVSLARLRLGERLVPHQLVGLAAALVAVGLLALA